MTNLLCNSVPGPAHEKMSKWRKAK
jgi:hypothetical protein